MKQRTAVLLAAYNGMQWIAAQVESILCQENVDIHLFISVDLSTDQTLAWCHGLAERDMRVTVLSGEERFGGAARNFFRLFVDVSFSDFGYVALADQDDIWLPDKLSAAQYFLSNNGYDAYSGNVVAFWSNGREVLVNKAQPQRRYDYFFEAAGPGCTYVFKVQPALNFKRFLIQNWTSLSQVSLHDWMIYAWFRISDYRWHIDPTPKVMYRQHTSNQVGANQGLQAAINRLRLLRAGWYRAEIAKIASLLGSLSSDCLSQSLMAGKIPRKLVFTYGNELRRRLRDRVFLAIIIIFGLY